MIEAAEAWAAQRSRPLDTDLLALALELRENHDDYPASYWPPRSAETGLIAMPMPSLMSPNQGGLSTDHENRPTKTSAVSPHGRTDR